MLSSIAKLSGSFLVFCLPTPAYPAVAADPRFARLLLGPDPKQDSWQAELFDQLAQTAESRQLVNGYLPVLSRDILTAMAKGNLSL